MADLKKDFLRGTKVVELVSAADGSSETKGSFPNVLMLGGFGRSGSTLLERCLAECPQAIGLGEVLHLWERGLRDNELCGCSLPFDQCEFWQTVGQKAFGGWANVDVCQAVADRRLVVRNRYLLELASGITHKKRKGPRTRLLDRVNAMYNVVGKEFDAELIIDSSKHPAYAYFLRQGKVNLKCVLVVRDPRGVAYSWSKVVARPETGSAGEFMPRYSTLAAVTNWTIYGVLFHALSLLRIDVKTVHYESFMKNPEAVVKEVLEFAGIVPKPLDTAHIHAGSVDLSAHHTVAGNPMRMLTGSVKFRTDEEWKDKMSVWDRVLASVVSFPMRLVYLRGTK